MTEEFKEIINTLEETIKKIKEEKKKEERN